MKLLSAGLPDYPGELIEAQTLAAGGCRREVYGHVAGAAIPAEARELVEELLAVGKAELPGVALALGFEFDPRRLRSEELLRRLVSAALLRHLGAREILASPVAYQSRARWDLYAPDIEALVALNHLCEETDAVQHVLNHHARAVLWTPAAVERRQSEGWHILRYTALEPWPRQRNWFDEVARQNERQSAEKRELQVGIRGLEPRFAAARSTLGRIYAALESGEYLTLAR